jgi:hypothetical protein
MLLQAVYSSRVPIFSRSFIPQLDRWAVGADTTRYANELWLDGRAVSWQQPIRVTQTSSLDLHFGSRLDYAREIMEMDLYDGKEPTWSNSSRDLAAAWKEAGLLSDTVSECVCDFRRTASYAGSA